MGQGFSPGLLSGLPAAPGVTPCGRDAWRHAVRDGASSWVRAVLLACLFAAAAFPAGSQVVAEKACLTGWATLSPAIGTEFAFSGRWSLDAALSYHPWKISGETSLRHWMASTEIRWWFCRHYEGSFWGIHAVAGQFNVRNLPFARMPRDHEYAGFMAGGGLGYGYHFPLSARWGMELSLGAGYLRILYDRFECRECREKVAEGKYNYFGPTRIGVSLVYFIQ